MKRTTLHQGTYTAGPRTLEYWTRCENCRNRKACRHTCDHPGWMRFLVNGKGLVGWSGIITLRKIARTVRDYLENEPPADVAMPMVQGRLEI